LVLHITSCFIKNFSTFYLAYYNNHENEHNLNYLFILLTDPKYMPHADSAAKDMRFLLTLGLCCRRERKARQNVQLDRNRLAE
jgi:hypothetical protein